MDKHNYNRTIVPKLALLYILIGMLVLGTSVSADDEIETEGVIAEIGDYWIEVNGLVFHIDDETEIEGDDDEELSFQDLVVGDFVEVEAEVQADSGYLATEIELEDGEHDGDYDIELTGAIESLSDNGLVVSGISFQVDENTEIFGDDGDDSVSFDELMVGMIVEIEANMDSLGQYLAVEIEVEDFYQDEIEVEAAIDELGSDHLVVAGISFQIDENTTIIDDDQQPIDFSVLQVGDIVEVRAEIQSDQSLLATHIELEDGLDDDDFELTGAIEFVGADFVDVAGLQFLVGTTTLILDHADNPIQLTDLEVGTIVEVDADVQSDGTLLATEIELEDSPGFSSNGGEIETIEADQVVLGGTTYLIDCCTVFLDEGFQPIVINEVYAGDEVELWFDASGNSEPLALQVKIIARGTTAIDAQERLKPGTFALHQNYPNPFNPTTNISYTLTTPGSVELTIYTVSGQKIRTLVDNEQQSAGLHTLVWNGLDQLERPVASSVYYYRMVVGGATVQTKKMVLLK